MNSSTFLEKAKEELLIEDRDITMQDAFRDYDEWSSLTFLSLITMIDEEFDLLIDPDEFSEYITWADLWDAIQAQLGESAE